MKPKNRVMCPDCGRPKMLFESKEKAMNFIKFNGDEITDGNKEKLRWYYCEACGGWHISSKEYSRKYEGKTQRLIDAYRKSQGYLDEFDKHKIKKDRESEICDMLYAAFMDDKEYGDIGKFIKKKYPYLSGEEKGTIISRLQHRIAFDTKEYWNNLTDEQKNKILAEIKEKASKLELSKKETLSWIKANYKKVPDGYFGNMVHEMFNLNDMQSQDDDNMTDNMTS